MTPRRKRSGPIELDYERYRRFQVALAEAGTNVSLWGAERGLTRSHVRQVALGARESERCLAEIVAYTMAQEEEMRRRLAVA